MPCFYSGTELQLFSELTAEECRFLLPFLEQEIFQKGDLVVHEGAIPAGLFLVLSGKVRREKVLGIKVGASGLEASQEKEFFEIREQGQSFCEHALIADDPTIAEWVAMEKVEILVLSRENFKQILQKSAQVGCKLLQALNCSLYKKFCRHQKQLAIGIENKRLIMQMRIERKKINSMHRIARSTSINNVNQTLETILDACMDCLDVQKGSIMIFNRGVLRVEAAFGKNKDRILGQIQPINDNSVSGRCFLNKKAVFIQNIEQEEGLQRTPDPDQYWNNSLISMPLIGPTGESIGVLNVSKTSRDVFTEDDMKILEDLTFEASAALGHEISLARLYRNFQETLLEVKEVQKFLTHVEKKIYNIIQASCPITESMGTPGNE